MESRKKITAKRNNPIGDYSFEEFKELARSFHGFPAPGLLIGGYMVEKAKEGLAPGTLFEAVVETEKCLPDAVQLLTPCSTGNGWMQVLSLGRYALSLYDKYTGRGRRVWINVESLEAWPEIRDWFLKRKPKQQQDTEALFSQIKEAGPAILAVASIQVNQRFLGKKSMGGVDICPFCGEAFPAKHGAACLACSDNSPYVREDTLQKETPPGPELRSVPAAEAVGKHALHDMTRIDPGRSKGPAFYAGQQIKEVDVCRLQKMGRETVYVREEAPDSGDWVHENDAALAFARAMAGEGISYNSLPKEGKINFRAARNGLFWLDREKLKRFNLVPDVICATRRSRIYVEKGELLAGCRALPLYISKKNTKTAVSVLESGPLFEVRRLHQAKIGLLITGTEIFRGLIEDKFAPVIKAKAERFDSEIVCSGVVPDDRQIIAENLKNMIETGCELIVTTAGLSVDPDDVTLPGLMDAGLSDIIYGAPVLPGAMTLIGRIDDTKILGVPACALFHKTTSLDLILPILLAGLEITRHDVAGMAEGGLCLNCKTCTFPKCHFG